MINKNKPDEKIKVGMREFISIKDKKSGKEILKKRG